MGDTKEGKNEAFLFGTLPSYSNHWPNGKEINRSKLANNMQPTSNGKTINNTGTIGKPLNFAGG